MQSTTYHGGPTVVEYFSSKSRDEMVSTMQRKHNEAISNPNVKSVYQVKIGRNDPCPCGSGKKFKKCHINSVQEVI